MLAAPDCAGGLPPRRETAQIVHMRYLALAADYDETIAAQGQVRMETFAALSLLRKSGRRTILVTGRELPDLRRVCPRLDLFDRVLAENGALLYRPQTGEEVALAGPPPAALVERLRGLGIPVSAGRSMVATREPHHAAALEAVRSLRLDLEVVRNNGAVMLLPPGVHKRSGLSVALSELGLSLRNTVAVGDAENDEAMLNASECGVAVANARASVKEVADLVLREHRGQGVEELIARLIKDDLRTVLLARHALLVGERRDGTGLRISPAARVLIAGPSGKATAAARLLAGVVAAGYQCCLVMDGRRVEGVPCVGSSGWAPSIDAVLRLLQRPNLHAAACLTAVPLRERPAFLDALLPRLQEMRARLGRPHWIVIDEAHQHFPRAAEPPPRTLQRGLGGILLLTAHPERLSVAVLQGVDTVLAAGDRPEETLRPFGQGRPEPLLEGEVLSWSNGQIEPLRVVAGEP